MNPRRLLAREVAMASALANHASGDELPSRAMNRRTLLRVGSVGLVGLSLPHLLEQQARAATNPAVHPSFGRAKSCILIFLKGGPSHLDTFDPKPDAPAEIRGEFGVIPTKVPGIQFSEHVPFLAAQADKFMVVRSLAHCDNGHPSAAYEMTTGHPYPRGMNQADISTREDHPHIGSSIAALDKTRSAMPPFALVPDYLVVNGQFRSGQNAGFLGTRFDPLVPHGDPSRNDFRPGDLGLGEPVEANRLRDRRALLSHLNGRLVRPASADPLSEMDSYREKAFSLLETGLTRRAFDLQAEPLTVRERYGRNFFGQSVLLGRRLIEAGVRLVHVN